MFTITPDYYEIRITDKKGRGVYARKAIPAGTVIGQYTGKILRHEDSMKSESDGHFHMHIIGDFYCLADKSSEGVQLINHSCAPNCAVEDYEGRALYFALRAIKEGEEITISYGLGRPDKYCNPCRHACFCGSRFCRGSWHSAEEGYDIESHTDPEEYKKILAETEEAVGSEIRPLTDYPHTLADNDWFEIFADEHHTPYINNDSHLPTAATIRSLLRTRGIPQAFPALGVIIYAIDGKMIYLETSK